MSPIVTQGLNSLFLITQGFENQQQDNFVSTNIIIVDDIIITDTVIAVNKIDENATYTIQQNYRQKYPFSFSKKVGNCILKNRFYTNEHATICVG